MQREIDFSWSANQKPVPFVREVFEYVNDGSAGHFVFDGYWYRNQPPADCDVDQQLPANSRYRQEYHPLPRPLEFMTKLVATEPFESGIDTSGTRYEKYAVSRIQTYRVIATAHTEIQNTSEFWHDDDAGGDICLFPTARQRIDFRVASLVEEKAADVRHTTYHTMWVPSSSFSFLTGTDIQDISAGEINILDAC